MSEIVNYFGAIEISDEKSEKLISFLDKLADSNPLPDNVVTRSIDFENGNVTQAQWDVSDFLFTSDKKYTLSDVADKMGKKNYNSIQKIRDGYVKNVIEAFITVSFILNEDENIFDKISEVMER
jgi:hypothetical protein